ncbi:MAG: hypothetical protein J5657_05265 [Clostridiales bacterium]|nr:hypothetical protein [Clostridiales bacterium]
MPDTAVAPISMKCKVCGGDIVNDYLAGVCICANCGNKWSVGDLIPDYAKYSRIVSGINKANETLNGAATVAATNEAKLLFKTSAAECGKIGDAVSADLLKLCNDGQEKASRLGTYIRGKDYFEKASYDNAARELSKVKGYKDSDVLIGQCKVRLQEERIRQIPWAVVFSLILPAILAIILKEKAGLPLGAVIPIFLVCSAGLGYVLYRGGIPSIIIKIISFLCAAPLVLFMILAYVVRIGVVPSAIISIALPVVGFVLFAMLTEQNK